MDLRDGFYIDDPPVVVPWSVSEVELERRLGTSVRRVADKYWTAPVRVLGGLYCSLGFHFRADRGELSELELYRDPPTDLVESFEDFQRHFEAAFGPPTERKMGDQEFPLCRWLVPGAEIVHFVFERFGTREIMRIRPTGAA